MPYSTIRGDDLDFVIPDGELGPIYPALGSLTPVLPDPIIGVVEPFTPTADTLYASRFIAPRNGNIAGGAFVTSDAVGTAGDVVGVALYGPDDAAISFENVQLPGMDVQGVKLFAFAEPPAVDVGDAYYFGLIVHATGSGVVGVTSDANVSQLFGEEPPLLTAGVAAAAWDSGMPVTLPALTAATKAIVTRLHYS